ncbi:MAG: putative rane protein [Acidimicrobiales bacterium]|nr:putative rane protein [Acidimicrobiales bacterium]
MVATSNTLDELAEVPDVEPPRSRLGAWVIVLVVVGVGLRAWISWGSHLGIPDADEAVSANMARAVLHGHLPAFYWGQNYGGTGETVLIAGAFRALGASAASLRVAPFGLAMAAVWLTWRIGRRALGAQAARIATGLAAIWPLGSVFWSTRARGFYGVGQVLSLATVLLAVRLADQDEPVASRRRDWLLLGLVVGAAWWTSPLCMVVVVPVLLWLLATHRPTLRDAALATIAFAVGALPWLVWNVRNGWASLTPLPQIQDHNGYVDHLHVFAVRGIPLVLGLQSPLRPGWILGRLVGPLVALAVLVWLAWVSRRLRGPARMLVLVALAYPFLLALSPYSWFLEDTRYLYLLNPLLALLVGAGLARYRAGVAGGALVAALVLSLVSFRSMDAHSPLDVRPLARALEERHLDRVAADYWIAYPLDLATRGRVVGTPISGAIRSQAAAEHVRRGARVAVVVAAGSPDERRFLQFMQGHPIIDTFAVDAFHVTVVGRPDAARLIGTG